ncbi:MAG: AAA family ATPase, partial [Promethearchaeota archaeon]
MNLVKNPQLNPQEVKELLSSDIGEILTNKEVQILEHKYSSQDYNPSRVSLQFARVKQKTKAIQPLLLQKIVSEKNRWWFLTGLDFLDSIFASSYNLKPGLASNSLIMVYGKARSGKTQICQTIPVKYYRNFFSQTKKSHKFVLYIDTEGTFRPNRIKEIAQFSKLDGEQILNQIISVTAQNYSQFNMFLKKVEDIFKTHPIRLLLIDSFTRIYRLAMAESPQDTPLIISNMAQNLRKIRNWAQKYNLFVCLTSQVSSRLDEGHFFEVSPILATTLNRYIKSWIMLGINDSENEIRGISGLRYAHV